MGDFFGRLEPEKKIFFDFFLVPPSGGPIGGPILDPFWTHFGPFLTILDQNWVKTSHGSRGRDSHGDPDCHIATLTAMATLTAIWRP